MKTGILLVSLVLGGCGAGSLSIQPYDKRSRPVETTLESIEKLPDLKTCNRKVDFLLEHEGDDLDWGSFWKSFAQRPTAKDTFAKLENCLVRLEARSCKATDYNSFLEFLISVGKGFDLITGESRKCTTAIEPLTAVKFIEIVGPSPESPTENQTLKSTQFLTAEIKKNPNPAWKLAFSKKFIQRLRRLLYVLPDSKRLEAMLLMDKGYYDAVSERLFTADLKQVNIFSPYVLTQIQADKNPSKALDFIEHFYSPSIKRTPASLVFFFNELVPKLYLNLEKSDKIEFIERLLALLVKLEREDTLSARLTYLQSLQEMYEEVYASESKEFLSSNILQEEKTDWLNLNALWVLLRLGASYERIAVPILSPSQGPSYPKSDLEYVLRARLKSFFDPSARVKKKAANDLCWFFEDHKIPLQRLSLDEWAVRKNPKKEPGCFLITDEKSIHLKFDTPLFLAWDSVTTFQGDKLTLEAPTFDLGIMNHSFSPDREMELGNKKGGGSLRLLSDIKPKPFGFISTTSLPNLVEPTPDGSFSWEKRILKE